MWTNVAEIESAIQNFANTYPTLAERIVLPELTWGDGAASPPRTVSALRIGANAADAADGALFLFGHHAREWIPPEVALELAASILGAYAGGTGIAYGGKSYSSADVQRIVNSINVFIVPCVNPDGRQFSLDHDVMSLTDGWRRNRRPNASPNCMGVDCNRNYDIVFDLNKYFDLSYAQVTNYNSTNPCNSNQVYQGPAAFSEPETRNIRWLLDTYGRIRWLIDLHGYTFDGEIYYPWGDDENQSTDPAKNWRNSAFDHQRGRPGDSYSEYLRAEDLASHVYLANRLRDGIQPVNGNLYTVKQSYDLYPTAGTSDDYAWSRHLVSPSLPRVESFAIEHRGSGFHTTTLLEQEEVIQELASGLINFSLACTGGVPGLIVTLRTSSVVFNHCPEGRVSSRPVILQVTGADAASFRVNSGPSWIGGSANISFGVAVGSQGVPASASPVTRDIYLWLTCAGGLAGNTATGTVRVECPEASFVADVPITADFVAAPRAGAVLALDRSGSMQEDGGDGRTRLQVLMDSAPGFVDAAPQGARLGLVRFATDDSPGAPMSTMGPEGSDPGGRDVIRGAISTHTIATGDAAWTSIGDGVYAGAALLAPESSVDFKSLVVLTDGFENRPRFLSEVSSLITDRVFAIGLGTPEQLQPVALQTLTNGTNGYLLMTGTLNTDDPFRLAKYYLQILTGVTNDQVVLDPGGWLPYGGTESIPFYLNEADAAVDAIVLMPVPALVRVRLRAPSGQIFDQSHPSMQWILGTHLGYYRYTLPVPGPWMAEGPGRWEILLDWKRKAAASREQTRKASASAAGVSPTAIRYDALVHARSDLEMTATVTQDRYTPGASVNLRVLLMQYGSVALDGAQVSAQIEFPDGAVTTQPLTGQGEGVYESNLTAALNGIYRIRITAQGKSLRGFAFTREAVRTAIVWRGGDAPPPTRHDDGWCNVLRCLVESKALNPEVLKRLGIDIKQLKACCEDLERIEGSPTIALAKTRPITRLKKEDKKKRGKRR